MSIFLFQNRKEKIQKKQKKEKPKKKKKKKKKRKKNSLFLVVLDKMYVFCLYPIPDSQQYVKRGSCRRPILFGLFFIFTLDWISSPFTSRFKFGPRTYSIMLFVYSIESLSHFVLFIYFMLIFVSYLIFMWFRRVVLLHINICLR